MLLEGHWMTIGCDHGSGCDQVLTVQCADEGHCSRFFYECGWRLVRGRKGDRHLCPTHAGRYHHVPHQEEGCLMGYNINAERDGQRLVSILRRAIYAGFSSQELADHLGVSRPTIDRWLAEQNLPHPRLRLSTITAVVELIEDNPRKPRVE